MFTERLATMCMSSVLPGFPGERDYIQNILPG